MADFFRRFRERYPYPPDLPPRPDPRGGDPRAAEGAAFAVERFGVAATDVARVELGGRLDVDRFGGADRVRRELPWSVQQLSRIRFGTIGPSNHFVELQEVVEVLDPRAAALLGLSLGQVTLQYHGGGGSLPGELGLLFGRRRRYPPVGAGADGRAEAALPLRARPVSRPAAAPTQPLFLGEPAPPIERDHAEGERLALANAMAMNYGFAFRLSTLREPPIAARQRASASATAARRRHRRTTRSMRSRSAGSRRSCIGTTPAGSSRRPRCAGHPVVRGDRTAAASARHQPHLVVPVHPGRARRDGRAAHRLPRRRHRRRRLRPTPGVDGSTRRRARRCASTTAADSAVTVPHLPDDGVDAVVRALETAWHRPPDRPPPSLRGSELRRPD